MKPETADLRRAVRHAASLAEKVAVLRDAYRGDVCYVLSCGPSLGTIAGAELGAALRDKLVVTVKQAYDVVPGISDFHLLNSTSFKRYRYHEPRPIVLFERGERDAPVWGCDPDLTFTVAGLGPGLTRAERLAGRLAVKENYDDYLFERSLVRPWGPGILLELGIYLAVHVGVSELIVVGWDLGPPNRSVYQHYYDRGESWFNGRTGLWLRRIARRGPFIGVQFIRHLLGYSYNTGTVEPDDTDVSVRSSYGMYRWLRTRGVRLSLLSDRSYLDERIPRLTWPLPGLSGRRSPVE